jgi:release factor glutamine methyltransferase
VVSSWLQNVNGQFDLIVSNPPYIPSTEIATLDRDVVDYDPHIALFGGADGLSCYRQIAQNVGPFLKVGGVVVVEIGAGQKPEVVNVFAAAGFELTTFRKDLGDHVRALAFRKKEL